MKPGRKVKSVDERIWKFIDKKDDYECWEWTGMIDKRGFGQILNNNKRMVGAHRIIYTLFNKDEDISNKIICHKCKNNKCVNPYHLFIGTMRDVNKLIDVEDRIWKFIDKKDDYECWEWNGYKNKQGYGQIKNNENVESAHRVIYKIFNKDEDITNKMICHKCDNPGCVNPNHMFSGTQNDNMQDMVKKGRQGKGETSGGNKLTNIQVQEIRYLYSNKIIKLQKDLANMYNIKNNTVSCIVNNKSWVSEETI